LRFSLHGEGWLFVMEKVLEDPHDLENWYDALREWTFETKFIALSSEELENICSVHDGKLDVSVLDGLKKTVAPFIGASEGAFVRLSTRSSKDWALRQERTSRIFQEEKQKLKAEREWESEDVVDVIAIVRSMSFALRVSSADEVMDMLTHSERSYQDCFRRFVCCLFLFSSFC
jgi:hypothetical protein